MQLDPMSSQEIGSQPAGFQHDLASPGSKRLRWGSAYLFRCVYKRVLRLLCGSLALASSPTKHTKLIVDMAGTIKFCKQFEVQL